MILKSELILPVTLESKELFDEYGHDRCGISFYDFSTLYMWQPSVGYTYAKVNDMLCVSGTDKDGKRFCYMPVPKDGIYDPEGLRAAVSDAIRVFGTERFYPLDGNMVELLRRTGLDVYSVVERRDLCDYVYDGDALRTLKGRAYHAKRNHINRFLSEYKLDYLEINADNTSELAHAAELFKQDGDSELADEYSAIKRLIDAFAQLGEKAGIIYADGQPVGYSIGRLFGRDTALIQVEKASKVTDGAYTVINNEFLLHSFSSARYINREEDMGYEHLRKAKLSYSPLPFNLIYEAHIAI